MYTYFKIGPIHLRIDSEYSFPWTDDLKVFHSLITTENLGTITADIHFTDSFSPIWGTKVYQDNSMIVMNVSQREYRVHLLPKTQEPFALTCHIDSHHVQVFIDSRAFPAIKWDRTLIGLLSLEHFCLSYDAFLLHASYIIYNGKAIVFTAPSGTGKSTQADLWSKYENAQIINGDRTLLFHDKEKWYASGFPVCGSSTFCMNEIAPVHAIICLGQGTYNELNLLPPVQALKNVYSQSFVNRWNPEDCNKISSLMTSLIQSVPTYKYYCTKEQDAVAELKRTLFQNI